MRKILTILAVSLGLLLVLAVAVEGLFGTWFSAEPLDQVGLVRNSQFTMSSTGLYGDGAYFVYHRDRWGFRGIDTDPAQVTLLTVGGSTTNQLYLSEDTTWQAVMERELTTVGHPVKVANAGIDGQGTIGHLRAMAEWFPNVPGLKPRFILFSVGIDDADAGGGAADQQVPSTGWSKRLRQNSALWQAGKKVVGMVMPRRARPKHQRVDPAVRQWTDIPAQPDWKPEGGRGLDAYRDRLRALARAAHDMGAVPVFVTQTRGDFKIVDGKVWGMVEENGLNGVDHYRRLLAFNQATRAVCAEDGLLCLDLAREVTFEPGDFYDYLHNTPQGAAKIGRWLAAKLAGLV